jgi:predicted site-specific integrase-resolvase
MLQNNIQFKDQEFLKPKDFTKLCGITYQTFWNWVKANKISVVKTQTNKYLISKSELLRLNLIKVKNINKINIIYARVSSTKQKDDLNRQIERLTKFCVVNNIKIDETFFEIASGMNYDRLKFNKILQLILENKVSKIIIEHKDRFCRFGFELFENLSKIYDFEFVITTNNPVEIESFENELTNDLISIIHHFSMKLYSNRRQKFKKLANDLKL